MKWTNKGHEFDVLGTQFQLHSDIYIYTNEEFARSLAGSLSFLNRPIRMIDPSIEHTEGNRVPLRDILGHPEGKTVLIPIGYTDPEGIRSRLEAGGFQWNINLFWSPDFMERFLPIYVLYVYDKVYFSYFSLIPSKVCNLNCRDCLVFTPYNRHKTHRPLEEIKQELALLFSCVDTVGFFHISGGEPLLYPQLGELLAHIAECYSSKIVRMGIVTNGSLLPSEKLLSILKRYDIQVECDDYRQALPHLKESFLQLIETLRVHQIKIQINTPITWINLFPPRCNYEKLSTSALMERFDRCAVPYTEMSGSYLAACNYASYAVAAGLSEFVPEDYFDLEQYTADKKRELVEFRMRYNMRGYVEFCENCNSFPRINPYTVSPAVQATGLLTWEGNKERDGAC